MGQSTDAILFFGYCHDSEGWPNADEDAYDVEEPDYPEEEYLRRKGLLSEDAAWEERRNKTEALPFEFFTHCHSECRMHAIAIRGTKVKAWRGYPQEIDPAMLQMTPEEIAKHEATLQEVCAVLEIKPTELRWWLVSDWS